MAEPEPRQELIRLLERAAKIAEREGYDDLRNCIGLALYLVRRRLDET